MDSLPTLRTERLLLTPLQLADADAIQHLFPHWEVVRYLDSRVPWPYPDDGALTYVRDLALPAMARGEEWHWMIRLASAPGDAIGSISLFDQPGNHRGFWLAPRWQGRGYMTEVCEAVTRYWFLTLERPLMQVPKAIVNQGSRRISEREGMRCIDSSEGHFVSGVLPRETWELTREEWLARHAAD
ncbi:GNAT family N-acetyltransferase [Pseudomonas sp. HS-18]|uniref:GNAT family N-acetyltransferase n=1 Tax=Pseudomonas sp. HS-18 TaxID=2879114 RepID=UPI001CEFE196|nr:GNAT family N-acetyltransferase [Pseudomonas sp. HS-18]UCL85015.1 GNAT family N-acetyltransferase [Pseudomonas sp. HS-18]